MSERGDYAPSQGLAGISRGPSVEEGPAAHRFWDKTNLRLHGANLVAQALDFWSTRKLMKRGYRELNPFARPFASSDAGMAAYSFGLSFGGTLVTSYLSHRTGHHRWERFIPTFVVGTTGAAVALNLRHIF